MTVSATASPAVAGAAGAGVGVAGVGVVSGTVGLGAAGLDVVGVVVGLAGTPTPFSDAPVRVALCGTPVGTCSHSGSRPRERLNAAAPAAAAQ
ncbi:hypothetical protein [Kineosporia sp. A_224]|uniref:hypothetical protein n=1 Tax=Kineosporia sp. A_224 TaxID=1962180 RepID=UPI000B4AA43F|nr:hypothetical protein [Kineosporia sp. A_224]